MNKLIQYIAFILSLNLVLASQLFTDINLAHFASDIGFKVVGGGTYDYLGSALSPAEDFNGDGIDDFLVGSRDYSNWLKGASYVIFGRANISEIDISTLTPNQGIKISGAAKYCCIWTNKDAFYRRL